MTSPYVRTIDDIGAFFEEQRLATEDANSKICDRQKAITFGSYWVRFHVMPPGIVIVIAGRVTTIEDFKTVEIEAGGSEEELEETLPQLQSRHDDGYMFGRAYSVLEPEGEYGSTHRSVMWPIDKSLYDALKANSWDFTNLDDWEAAHLEDAYQSYRSWMIAAYDRDSDT